MITTQYITINNYKNTPHNNKISLKKTITHQPINIIIKTKNIKLYKSITLLIHIFTKKN